MEGVETAIPNSISQKDLGLSIPIRDIKNTAILFTAGIFFVALTSLFVVSLSIGFAWTNTNFKTMHKRIDGLEIRMDGLDKRMDGLEQRMDGLEQRMDKMAEDITEIKQLLSRHFKK